MPYYKPYYPIQISNLISFMSGLARWNRPHILAIGRGGSGKHEPRMKSRNRTRNRVLVLYLTDAEKHMLEDLARQKGEAQSAYIRRLIWESYGNLQGMKEKVEDGSIKSD